MALAQVPREIIHINPDGPSRPFPHYWETDVRIWTRDSFSSRELSPGFANAQRSSPAVEYVRFHAILHDEVGVYDEDAKGKPVYNFSYVDQIYDGLLQKA